jgi:hypothetical protein
MVVRVADLEVLCSLGSAASWICSLALALAVCLCPVANASHAEGIFCWLNYSFSGLSLNELGQMARVTGPLVRHWVIPWLILCVN